MADNMNRMRSSLSGPYGTYRDALMEKPKAESFEAPPAKMEKKEAAPSPSSANKNMKSNIQFVESYMPDPEKDFTFEDLNKTYNYTVKPNGDIYFTNKAKQRSGVIPAGDQSAKAIKARNAIMKMKQNAPRAVPYEKPDYQLRNAPAPGSTPDTTLADMT